MTTSSPPQAHRVSPLVRLLAVRLRGALVLLLTISLLVFSLLHLAPGDVVKNLIGARNVSPETIAAIRAQYRLDDPFLVQYLSWLGGVLGGDFGRSIRFQEPVTVVLAARLGPTLLLALASFFVAVVTAIPLGVLSAVRAGSVLDRFIATGAILGISAPAFAASLLMLYVFSFSLGWFPLYGLGRGGLDTVRHLVLPAVTLALGLGAILTKITRTAMIRELGQEHITFARARGLPPRRIRAIALRGALVPIVTGAGLVLSYLVGGTIFVETVFALPGLGTLLHDAVIFQDIPVVQAVTLVIATAIIAVAVAVDLAYRVLDPRLRRQEQSA